MHANVTWPKRYQVVFGRRMAYVESGVGDPIIFCMAIRSSYVWRNVVPYLNSLGRCIAPDLIGIADSDKLPDSGPARTRSSSTDATWTYCWTGDMLHAVEVHADPHTLFDAIATQSGQTAFWTVDPYMS